MNSFQILQLFSSQLLSVERWSVLGVMVHSCTPKTVHHCAVLCKCSRVTFVDNASQPWILTQNKYTAFKHHQSLCWVLRMQRMGSFFMVWFLETVIEEPLLCMIYTMIHSEWWYVGLKTCPFFPRSHSAKCLCLLALERAPESRPVSSLVFTLVLPNYLAQRRALRECSLHFQRSPYLSHESWFLVLVLLIDVLRSGCCIHR